MVPLALIVTIGLGGALIALGAAERTRSAFTRYLDRADVGDVVINPSLMSTASDELIRDLPGVQSATRDALFLATMDEGRPRTRSELDADPAGFQARGSRDGRYVAMDRPAFATGRFPSGPKEALVNSELADTRDVSIGDVIPVSFWSSRDGVVGGPESVLEPVGVEHLTVVGIATLHDEVLPDGLYPRGRLIVSPDVAERYDCLPEPPSTDASLDEAVQRLLPALCSTSYPYYSLKVAGGDEGVDIALEAFRDGAADLNATLPEALLSDGASYSLIATTTAEERERVERSVEPMVTTLLVLAGTTAAAALVVLGLAVTRALRRAEGDQLEWWRLGLTTRNRLGVLVVPHLVSAGIGIAGALALAWASSPLAPIGTVRSVDPFPARGLSGEIALAAASFALLCVVGLTVLASRATRRAGPAPVRPHDRTAVRRMLRGSARPDVDEGLRAAFGRDRGAGLVVAGGGLATGILIVAVVFSGSLAALVSTPASYGWPWDVAVMGGYGYGSQDLRAVTASLETRDDIESWTALAFATFTVDGAPVVSMVALGPPADVQLTPATGRLPTSEHEVALGTRTAAERNVGVGDQVDLAGEGLEPVRATVTGLVVLPALGPYQADRAAPGTGLLVPASMVDEEVLANEISFFGIDVAHDADVTAVLDELRRDFVSWAIRGDTTFEYARPVRPAEIINAGSMRAVPLLVGGLLALAGAVALSFAVMTSVRARRRDLAALRALGFTGRQLRASVLVHAVATMLASLLIGIPIGVGAGRLAWRVFASQLGVVTGPSTPRSALVATIAGGVAIAVAAAVVPARAAARARSVTALRSE